MERAGEVPALLGTRLQRAWGVGFRAVSSRGANSRTDYRTDERAKIMPVIKLKDNESIEQAMKRFKKTCEKAGILTELRRREYYDKPSIRKKKKAAAARKRALKKMRRVTH